eukprot:1769940-Amphidinium_carterae.1
MSQLATRRTIINSTGTLSLVMRKLLLSHEHSRMGSKGYAEDHNASGFHFGGSGTMAGRLHHQTKCGSEGCSPDGAERTSHSDTGSVETTDDVGLETGIGMGTHEC